VGGLDDCGQEVRPGAAGSAEDGGRAPSSLCSCVKCLDTLHMMNMSLASTCIVIQHNIQIDLLV
jgi:hypothetical protein